MIAILGVIVLITILVWGIVGEALFMGNYQQLERTDVQDALGATRYSLGRSLGDMNASARDYAAWDDTYSFVVTNNTAYVTDNLIGGTFDDLHLNLVVIENTNGTIVVAKAYDLVNKSFVALPGDLDTLASTDSPLFFHNESAGTSTGVLYTANGPLLVASQPILTSAGTGPIHGTLIFGRYLTPDVMDAIAGPNTAASVYPFGAQAPNDVQRVQQALAGGASSVVEPLNATDVAGFTLLRDINGNPSLVVKEVLPRDIYQAGQSSTNTFLVLLVILGAISLTGMVWSLRRSVLSPLLRINESLARVRTKDDLSKRVPERGDVEIVWLARAINATLASLETSHAERVAIDEALRSSEQRFRAVAESAADAIVTMDSSSVITYWNSAAEIMFGYAPAEVNGESITAIFSDTFGEACLAAATLGSASDSSVTQAFTVKRKDGTTVPVEPRFSAWKTRDGQFVTAIIRDITERQRAEEQIQASLREKELLLSEIHHRVKNNLQIVSSLLSLQSNYVTDADALAMFGESQQRVKSMALIHEKLYQSEDFAHIDFSDYLTALTSDLSSAYYRPSVRLVIDSSMTGVDITTAIPCGLIVNELVTNALKHAFPGEREGIITVNLRTNDAGTHVLSVSDDGVGFPEDLDFRNTTSLGLQLVTALVDQLDGTITLDRTNGTRFIITFKPAGAHSRVDGRE
jgi:PAS domain S-box-containing protein